MSDADDKPPPQSAVLADARYLRRNRLLHAAIALPWLAWPFVLALTTGGAAFITLAILAQIGLVSGFEVLRRNPFPARERCGVRVDEQALHLGRWKFARTSFQSGLLFRRDEALIVRLERRRALPVELEVDDEAQGRALLRALGWGAEQTSARFAALSPLLSSPVRFALLGVFSVLLPVLISAIQGSPLAMLFAIAMLTAAVVPSRLQVGVDGVLITWLGTRRFLRFADIQSVTRHTRQRLKASGAGVRFQLQSGELVDVLVGDEKQEKDRLAMMLQRILEALEVHRRGDGEASATALARGQRTIPAWIQSLRGLGLGAGASHRVAAVSTERLLRIAMDPKKPSSERAAAAVALNAEPSPDVRTQLRTAAETTVAPELRAAFEAAIATDREAELEAALAELELDQRAPAAPGRA